MKTEVESTPPHWWETAPPRVGRGGGGGCGGGGGGQGGARGGQAGGAPSMAPSEPEDTEEIHSAERSAWCHLEQTVPEVESTDPVRWKTALPRTKTC